MNSNDSRNTGPRQSKWRLGVVSFLNSRPLIYGLERERRVQLCFDVPSRLTDRLLGGEFDVALVPVIDLLHQEHALQVVSDACIGCNGETLTVRVFSKVPPDQIRRIELDTDSRTSAALVQLIWPRVFRRQVEYRTISTAQGVEACESVLLIGDKVVSVDESKFRYQVDLGGAWKTWTGLPFVFAVWAAPQGGDYQEIAALLSSARQQGVKRAGQLAVEYGPALGWPTSKAQQYLQRYLSFSLTETHVEGMIRFLDLVREERLTAGTRREHAIQ